MSIWCWMYTSILRVAWCRWTKCPRLSTEVRSKWIASTSSFQSWPTNQPDNQPTSTTLRLSINLEEQAHCAALLSCPCVSWSTGNVSHEMLSVLRKARLKDKEMRVLMLYGFHTNETSWDTNHAEDLTMPERQPLWRESWTRMSILSAQH